jgi:hypothetical protein
MLSPTAVAEARRRGQRLALGQQLADIDAARARQAPQVALRDVDPAALVCGELATGEPRRARDVGARQPLLLADLPEMAAQLLARLRLPPGTIGGGMGTTAPR